MISRFTKILYLIFILSAAVILSGPAEAAYSPDFCKKLDMLKVAQEMMNQADSGTYSSSETAMLAVGDMYNTAWPVTCFVGYGLHNFEEAVEFLTKEENVKKIISRSTGVDTPSGANMNITITTTNDLVEAIKDQGLLEGTVYNRAQMAGFILLIVFFIGSLTYYVAQIFLGTDEANPLDIMFLFIRFATLAIILAFLRPMIFLGLEASTLLRGSLVNTPVTVVAGLGQTASASKFWPKDSKVYNPWLKADAVVTGGFGVMDTVTNADGTTRSRSSGHKGIDFRAQRPTQIYAPVSGYMTCKGSNTADTGFYIEITESTSEDHKNTQKLHPFRHRALHLSKFTVPECNSSKPIHVNKGDPVGMTGNSGQYLGMTGQKGN